MVASDRLGIGWDHCMMLVRDRLKVILTCHVYIGMAVHRAVDPKHWSRGHKDLWSVVIGPQFVCRIKWYGFFLSVQFSLRDSCLPWALDIQHCPVVLLMELTFECIPNKQSTQGDTGGRKGLLYHCNISLEPENVIA